jgi:predicted ATP-binding protein involved in virulence
MILPEDFPYITSIYVNDCYTYQNFNIELIRHQPFSHLILTGENGSGKSTILKYLDKYFISYLSGSAPYKIIKEKRKFILENKRDFDLINLAQSEIKEYKSLIPNFVEFTGWSFSYESRKQIIYSYVLPYRNSKVNKVESPSKQDVFEEQLTKYSTSTDYFVKNFKQYLVNKKVNQAFAQLDNDKLEIENTETFFQKIELIFSQIFKDEHLKLEFHKESYEFYIKLSNGRELTFDILPDGFSAFLSILMDLFVRLDLIRKNVGNNTYNPCGVVLIDEPETHLHISLQYHVLPILTTLFPNVQFIVATHSPAVISSIKNSTIFDLTTKETLSSDDAIGKSFSELMVSHFGLDNEFSDFTDDLFDKVNTVLKENKSNIPLRNQQLKAILKENERYISPTMRFELEAKISE